MKATGIEVSLSLECGCDPVKAELAYFLGDRNSVRIRQTQARFNDFLDESSNQLEKESARVHGSGFMLEHVLV